MTIVPIRRSRSIEGQLAPEYAGPVIASRHTSLPMTAIRSLVSKLTPSFVDATPLSGIALLTACLMIGVSQTPSTKPLLWIGEALVMLPTLLCVPRHPSCKWL